MNMMTIQIQEKRKLIFNSTNELIELFDKKCVICLVGDKPSVYTFPSCSNQCLCEAWYRLLKSEALLTICVVCREYFYCKYMVAYVPHFVGEIVF